MIQKFGEHYHAGYNEQTSHYSLLSPGGYTDKNIQSVAEINGLLEMQFLKAIAQHDFDWLSGHGFID